MSMLQEDNKNSCKTNLHFAFCVQNTLLVSNWISKCLNRRVTVLPQDDYKNLKQELLLAGILKQLNLKQVSGLVLHLIFHCLTVKCHFVT